VKSAFDEFLQARVPIQLGGLQDPFSPLERTRRVTLRLLQVLQHYDYPTIISTKATIPTEEPYLSLLREMNVLVRFSAAGVEEKARPRLEIGCKPIQEILNAIALLADSRIPVSLRVQPVIPGHEDAAIELTNLAARAGVAHISFEYLKIGTEERQQTIGRISNAIGDDVWEIMSQRGIKRLGRDYTLTAEAKVAFLKRAKQACRCAGVRFGAGDTEFIHESDGAGCCNGSTYFLRNAQQFRANFVGAIRNAGRTNLIEFATLKKEWQPQLNVHRYLTTNSRGRVSNPKLSDWMALVAHRWNGTNGPYSPAFFHGIEWTGRYDRDGYKIYRRKPAL
jgi:DNA repair photolyase